MKEIFHRTSVRNFTDKKVEPEKMEKILKAAMQAPTAGNQQAWEFYIVEDSEILKKLAKASPYAGCTANAPVAVVVVNKKESRFPELLDVDAAIATENIWLEADALGLGTVMLAVAPFQDRMEAVGKILNLGEDEYAFDIIPIGYPVKESVQQDRYDEKKIHYIR